MIALIIAFLLLVYPVYGYADWGNRLGDAYDVDQTLQTEDQSYVWDETLQLWVPTDIIALTDGDASISGNLTVSGNTLLIGDVGIGEQPPSGVELYIAGDAGMSGNLTVGGTATIDGATTISNDLTLGDTTASLWTDNIEGYSGNAVTIEDVVIPTIFNDTAEPTGFINRTDSSLSFNDASFTFTITGTDFEVYFNGVKKLKNTESITLGDTTNIHWIYYDKTTEVLSENTTLPTYDNPFIASVYWNTTTNLGLLGDERHGVVMDWHTHTLEHLTVGTRYESGLTGTFDNTTLSITSGVIDDEDITHIIGAQTTADVLYKNGTANFEWDLAQTTYYKEVTGTLQYNNGNALANVGNNKYIAMWVFATNDTTTPITALMGQRQDTTLAQARANNKFESLTLGTLPFQEMKILYRVLLRNQGGTTTWIENQDLRSISNIPAGTFIATDHGVLTNLDWSLSGHNDTDLNINYNADNRVGIGTTAPSQKLEVTGTSIAVSGNEIDFSDTTDEYVLAFDTGTQKWRGVVAVAGTGGATGLGSYATNFTDGDLVAGVLTVTHSLSSDDVIIHIHDNNGKTIIPDDIDETSTNTATVDLTTYGTISGTWRVVVLAGGVPGSDTHVLFNKDGDYGTDPGFTFEDTNDVLQIAGNVGIGGNLTVAGTTSITSDLTLSGSTSNLYVEGFADIAGVINVASDVAGVSAGDIRYNSTDVALEYYDGTNWHDAGSPKYIFIKATTQNEDTDIHLSDATNWAVSKALIKSIRVETSATDWDLYLLQNDNGHATDDANIPEIQIMEAGNGNEVIFLDHAYDDEDDSSEVHIYFHDDAASNTFDIYVVGVQMR